MEFQSSADTEHWARGFARTLLRPCVVLLDGELGAGKTQLVRWMVSALGGPQASSPTFAIHQTYSSSTGDIEHVDLYRLESLADLESTGFWEFLRSDSLLMFVEWSERVPNELWPKNLRRLQLRIAKISDQGRRIELTD